MACDNPEVLTAQDITDLTANIKKVNEWVEGDETTVVSMGGKDVPSPSKLITDAQLYKPAIAWPGAGTVTDATQSYIGGDDIIYAANPALLPLSVTGVFATDILVANAWYVVTLHRPIKVVESILDLLNEAGSATYNVRVNSYNAPIYATPTPFDGGGGEFVWDSTQNKANADFGTIFDPTVSLVNQGTGIGTGCWIRSSSDNITFNMFGATGDGTTDDTVAIQDALSTAYLSVKGVPGSTYIVDGGLLSSVAERIINLEGCIIKLKASAASWKILRVTGDHTRIFNGTYDGNKANGNSGTTNPEKYTAACIAIAADKCFVAGATFKDSYGIGVHGEPDVSDLTVINAQSTGLELAGVFISAPAIASTTGNRVVQCNFDMTGNTTQVIAGAHGILFTSLYDQATDTGLAHTDWLIQDNVIALHSVATASSPLTNVGASVRGYAGVYTNNTVTSGGIGITEGANGTRYIGNRCIDQYYAGIEPMGNNIVVEGNTVSGSTQYGISSAATTITRENVIISNNTISECIIAAIYINPHGAVSISNLGIYGNSTSTSGTANAVLLGSGIYDSTSIQSNNMKGNGVGRCVQIDNPDTTSTIAVNNNHIENYTIPFTVFSTAALIVNNMIAAGNTLVNITAGNDKWSFTGAAVAGANMVYKNNNTNGGIYSAWQKITPHSAPVAKTTAVTLTFIDILKGIVTGSHAVGATQAYTLPTGTLMDSGMLYNNVIGSSFEWSLINLSAAALDTITITAGVGHTLVGSGVVQSAHATTGALYGNAARFMTRKTAANTFITYRIG